MINLSDLIGSSYELPSRPIEGRLRERFFGVGRGVNRLGKAVEVLRVRSTSPKDDRVHFKPLITSTLAPEPIVDAPASASQEPAEKPNTVDPVNNDTEQTAAVDLEEMFEARGAQPQDERVTRARQTVNEAFTSKELADAATAKATV